MRVGEGGKERERARAGGAECERERVGRASVGVDAGRRCERVYIRARAPRRAHAPATRAHSRSGPLAPPPCRRQPHQGPHHQHAAPLLAVAARGGGLPVRVHHGARVRATAGGESGAQVVAGVCASTRPRPRASALARTGATPHARPVSGAIRPLVRSRPRPHNSPSCAPPRAPSPRTSTRSWSTRRGRRCGGGGWRPASAAAACTRRPRSPRSHAQAELAKAANATLKSWSIKYFKGARRGAPPAHAVLLARAHAPLAPRPQVSARRRPPTPSSTSRTSTRTRSTS